MSSKYIAAIVLLTLFCVPVNALVCERSAFSDIDCNNIAEIYSYQRNYFDGSWKAVDTNILNTGCGADYTSCANGNFYANFKNTLNLADSIKVERNGYFITFQPSRVNYRNDQENVQQIEITQPVSGVVNGNTINYAGIFGTGLDMKLVYLPQILKENIEVAVSFLPSPNSDITSGTNPTVDIDFVMKFDSSLDFIVDGSPWDKSSTVNGEEIVLQSGGATQLVLPRPYVYSNGSFVYGNYQLTKSGPRYYLIVKVPLSFVESHETVSIDSNIGPENNRYDGFVYASGRNYDFIFAKLTNNENVFFDFDISSIPDNASIKTVSLFFYYSGPDKETNFKKLNQRASLLSDSNLYSSIESGENYASSSVKEGQNIVSLDASSFLQSKLNENWFSFGMKTNTTDEGLIFTAENTEISKRPKLIVEYEIPLESLTLLIQSPVNTTYTSQPGLGYAVAGADRCWYELNGAGNLLINCQNLSSIGSPGHNRLTIYANDSSGNTISQTVEFTFNQELEITNIITDDMTSSSALILWNTNLPSSSIVYYGLGGNNLIKTESSAVTAHQILLAGLEKNATYYYNVSSCSSICKVSSQKTFKTLEKCAENWRCDEWSSCSGGSQSRTCYDSNGCGTIINKPYGTQSCTSQRPKEGVVEVSQGSLDEAPEYNITDLPVVEAMQDLQIKLSVPEFIESGSYFNATVIITSQKDFYNLVLEVYDKSYNITHLASGDNRFQYTLKAPEAKGEFLLEASLKGVGVEVSYSKIVKLNYRPLFLYVDTMEFGNRTELKINMKNYDAAALAEVQIIKVDGPLVYSDRIDGRVNYKASLVLTSPGYYDIVAKLVKNGVVVDTRRQRITVQIELYERFSILWAILTVVLVIAFLSMIIAIRAKKMGFSNYRIWLRESKKNRIENRISKLSDKLESGRIEQSIYETKKEQLSKRVDEIEKIIDEIKKKNE